MTDCSLSKIILQTWNMYRDWLVSDRLKKIKVINTDEINQIKFLKFLSETISILILLRYINSNLGKRNQKFILKIYKIPNCNKFTISNDKGSLTNIYLLKILIPGIITKTKNNYHHNLM